MPVRNDGIICRECGGAGCLTCSYAGYSYMRSQDIPESTLADIVPMPYGKILPDLTNCHYTNEPEWDSYLGPILCPDCESDHVVMLSNKHNPWIQEEGDMLSARWFCISCQESWQYEREI